MRLTTAAVICAVFVVLGIEDDPDMVARHQSAGRNVLLADATDDEFWARVGTGGKVRVIILAMPEYEQNKAIAEHGNAVRPKGERLFSVADYPEQREALKAAGIDAVWDFDTEAGTGFAEQVIAELGDTLPAQPAG